eukprot:SAG31_NODE_9616_length_1250_cov_1.517811_1_plen_85_part_10
MSHSLIVVSRPPVRSQFPFLFHRQTDTSALCSDVAIPCRVKCKVAAMRVRQVHIELKSDQTYRRYYAAGCHLAEPKERLLRSCRR